MSRHGHSLTAGLLRAGVCALVACATMAALAAGAERAAGSTGATPSGPSIATLTSPTHPVQTVWYSDSSPQLDWSATDAAGIAGYAYAMDHSSTTIPAPTSEGTASSVTYSDLADGTWYFHVRAENGQGVWGPVATRAVRIDTTAPTTSAKAPAGWRDRSVTVTFSATDAGSGVATTACSLDGGATWRQGGSVTVAAPADHSGDGLHTILYRSTDQAGNVEAQQAVTVAIDTRPPRFSWRALRPSVLYRTEPVRLRFLVADRTGKVRASYRIYDEWGVCVAHGRPRSLSPGQLSFTVHPSYRGGRGLVPGLYLVRLELVDAAGNATLTRPMAFRDYRPVRAAVWREVPGTGRRIALTFDDGYDKAAWAAILGVLHARDTHATFFVNGRYVAGYPTLARRTIAWGNAVGSHTWSHTLTTTESAAQIRTEIERDVDAWWRVARVTPVPYFRPPYGGYDATTLAVAGSLGFARVVLWSVDPSDYTDPGAAAIASRVLSQARPGYIVTMHVLPETAAALPAIIAGLRARGYVLVTLPALFRAAQRGHGPGR